MRHFVYLSGLLIATCTLAEPLPDKLDCMALGTAGFHDYPHNEESYESVVFVETDFSLRINKALMRHLDTPGVDLFLTYRDDEQTVELACQRLRGAGATQGYSCRNTPPSEMILLNEETLRFTRTSIGGWAFAAADENTAGDSIFVEYGRCSPN